MKAKTYTIVGLIGLFIASIFFYGLFSVTDSPTCIFTDDNKVCTVNYVLPENRSMSTFKMNLQFGKVPATNFGDEEILTRITNASTREENCGSSGCDVERFTWYLWQPTTEWPEVAEVKLTQTSNTRTSCPLEGNDVRVISRVYAATIPSVNSLPVVKDATADANPNSYLLVQDRDSGGDYYTDARNVFEAGGGVIVGSDCRYRSAAQTTDLVYNTVGVIPIEGLQTIPSQQRFLSYVSFDIDADGGTGSNLAEPVMKASYKQALYPTNVKYSTGNVYVDTLSGIQKSNISTLDFASQVNTACKRTQTIKECSFNVTFISEQNGKMWVDTFETLKIADAPTQPLENSSGFMNWLKSVWEWIKGLFTW